MSFDDLPDDWTTRPVDDPELVADVLDLVVSIADRRQGGLALLLCDDDRTLVQPVVLSDLPRGTSAAERRELFGAFVQAMDNHGSLLVAVARADGLSITADDRDWAAAASEVCAGAVDFLGLHVVTMGGSREVPRDERAA